MKKVLLAAAVLVLGATTMSAQKATPWFISGSAEFTNIKAGDADGVSNYAIRPQVGYMFNDNWGIALDLNFGVLKSGQVFESLVDGEGKVTTFGGGLRGLYSLKITDKFFYTPSLRVGYESQKAETEGVDEDVKYNTFGVDLNFLGFEFRPSCHWGFTTNFGAVSFASGKADFDGAKATTLFGIGAFDGVEVGFKYYF